MFAPHMLLPGAISDLFASASETGALTQNDRYGLQAAILTDDMTVEERDTVNRLLRAVTRHRVAIR